MVDAKVDSEDPQGNGAAVKDSHESRGRMPKLLRKKHQ